MDRARLGVIAVSLFFVISIIATSLLYSFPDVEQPIEGLSDVDPLRLELQAKDVPAKVVLMLPRMQIIAQTSESNISLIDSQIYSIPGVKNVSSQFILPEQTDVSTGLTYVADVQLSQELDAEQALSLIEEKALFDSLDAFPYALVDVPEEIEFAHPDLNMSRTHSLRDNEAMAIVLLGTLPGDDLEVEIDATFIGNEVINIFAFETMNLSAVPQFNETSLEAEIASLQPKLLLDIATNYSQLSSLESVEQQILSMQGVTDFNLTKPFLEAKISLISDFNISAEKATDLNSFLQSISDDVIFYNESFFRASLFFEEGADLLPIEGSISEKLAELELAEIVLQEPIGYAEGGALLESNDASATMPAIKALLESQGFEDFFVLQEGKISLAEITTDENTTYAIDSGLVDTAFSQPHSVGETVEVRIAYNILREEIIEISAFEGE